MLFADGKREVDYVLTFNISNRSDRTQLEAFLTNLLQHGFDIELEDATGRNPREFREGTSLEDWETERESFAKLHLQWETLLKVAQKLRFLKPIKSGNAIVYKAFSLEKRESFEGFEESNRGFFNQRELIMAAKCVLMNDSGLPTNPNETERGSLIKKPIYIRDLMRKNIILTADPLHEKPTKGSLREKLLERWANNRRILDKQPLKDIREYFGEKVALCFAWIEYNIFAFLVLFFVALAASLTTPFLRNPPQSIYKDVCRRNSSTYLLCPSCVDGTCNFRRLKASCGDIQWSYFFDNPASVFLAFIAPIFGMVYIKVWMYRQSKLQQQWNMEKFKSSDDAHRSQYEWRFGEGRKHRISYKTFRRLVLPFTCTGTVLLVSMSIALEFSSNIVEALIAGKFNLSILETKAIVAVLTGLVTCILSKLYKLWINWSTWLECPRTQHDEEKSLWAKFAFMEFINMFFEFYYEIACRAFNYRYPGYDSVIFDELEWPVWSGLFGIFYEFVIKCTVIVIVKSTSDIMSLMLKKSVKSLVYPCVGSSKGAKDSDPPHASSSYMECKYNARLLPPEKSPIFDRQLDLCIYFGFAVMFLPASFTWLLPLLLLSVLTVRGFAMRIAIQTRRIAPVREKTIGIWMWFLRGILIISIPTNATLIAFGTEFVNKLVYQLAYSPDGTLRGYVDFTLSHMDVTEFEFSAADKKILKGAPYCRYFGYREPPNGTNPYALTPVFYHILWARLGFVLIFTVVEIGVLIALNRILPNKPKKPKSPPSGTELAIHPLANGDQAEA